LHRLSSEINSQCLSYGSSKYIDRVICSVFIVIGSLLPSTNVLSETRSSNQFSEDSRNDVIRILVQEIGSSISIANRAKHDESMLFAGRRWRQPPDHIFVELKPEGRHILGSIPNGV